MLNNIVKYIFFVSLNEKIDDPGYFGSFGWFEIVYLGWFSSQIFLFQVVPGCIPAL